MPARMLRMPKAIDQPDDADAPGLGESHDALDDPADADEGDGEDHQGDGRGGDVLQREDADEDQQHSENDVECAGAAADPAAEDPDAEAQHAGDEEVDAEEDRRARRCVFSGQNSSTTPRISPTAPLMPSAVRMALMAERVM